jgi:tRNA uridine 5-carboxymethylaminomethyl modification enzyme
MVDDLTLQGVTEPYRMLTARAEYRLRLRADNAEERLTPLAIGAGCVSEERKQHFAANKRARVLCQGLLEARVAPADMVSVVPGLSASGPSQSLADWIRYPQVNIKTLLALAPELASVPRETLASALEDHRYAPYLTRQDAEISRVAADGHVTIPAGFDFAAVPGLSNEMVERLGMARPGTLGAASRIRGITPAALAAILVHARRKAA